MWGLFLVCDTLNAYNVPHFSIFICEDDFWNFIEPDIRKLLFQILSKYVILCMRTQCKVVPIIGRVTYVDFFYAQICAIGGF